MVLTFYCKIYFPEETLDLVDSIITIFYGWSNFNISDIWCIPKYQLFVFVH